MKLINIFLIILNILICPGCKIITDQANKTVEKKNKKTFTSEPPISISDNIIESEYTGDNWVNSVQLNPNFNILVNDFNLLLGNPKYTAISYSGYRRNTREHIPGIKEIKEDLLLLSSMGIRLIRTYHSNGLYMQNVVQAIDELRKENPSFEMYMMMGAWIQCIDAYTNNVDHTNEDFEFNLKEINKTIEYAATYPDIIKIIAVGNEAMVTWQQHWVDSSVILKWVRYLKSSKIKAKNGFFLPKDILVTSSDNFATWGAQKEYRKPSLKNLIREVDFISLHTYPYHDTHYNNSFWKLPSKFKYMCNEEKIKKGMENSFKYAVNQYNLVKEYIKSIGIIKPIHIGETGWSTMDDGFYSETGSRAADELKMKIFYDSMRKWTADNNISMFYFEAFDEPWKGGVNGSESHFGLFTVDGIAKYVLWDELDGGIFKGLKRGNDIKKTFNGKRDQLFYHVKPPPQCD